MGTKNNPGTFDCYEAAEPDEPLFVLTGHDDFAPHMVQIWACLRMGANAQARQAFNSLCDAATQRQTARREHPALVDRDNRKAVEASACALAMIEWKEQH